MGTIPLPIRGGKRVGMGARARISPAQSDVFTVGSTVGKGGRFDAGSLSMCPSSNFFEKVRNIRTTFALRQAL
jgi:hypothetical protein